MKLLTQIIALLVVTEHILQIAIAIAGMLFLVHFLSEQLKNARSKAIARKRRKALEDNMWAIN